MNEQIELPLAVADDAEETEVRLRELLAVLHDAKRWMTRRELEALGFTDRELRVLAESDREAAIFSYPGSPGYKHFDWVEDAEFDRCGALRSQARRMIGRHIRYQRRWHRRGKGR